MLKNPVDYIKPLNMNGLQGRMLRLPARRKSSKEILVVYGHHAQLERWWGLVENLQQYGNVTMPDLPGFGGMDSFGSIGVKPNIDSYADYLASFIKLRYRNRRIKLIGISYGFVIVTRMLQRYPELAGKIDLLISAMGFSHFDDFRFSKTRRRSYRFLTRAVAIRPMSALFKLVGLNPPMIRLLYARTYNARHKFSDIKSQAEFDKLMAMETRLWAVNDVRTHMLTSHEFLGLNNCKIAVELPVHHIYSEYDNYFDEDMVEQHLQVIFPKVTVHKAPLKHHIVSVVADKKEAGQLLPSAIKKLLSK